MAPAWVNDAIDTMETIRGQREETWVHIVYDKNDRFHNSGVWREMMKRVRSTVFYDEGHVKDLTAMEEFLGEGRDVKSTYVHYMPSNSDPVNELPWDFIHYLTMGRMPINNKFKPVQVFLLVSKDPVPDVEFAGCLDDRVRARGMKISKVDVTEENV